MYFLSNNLREYWLHESIIKNISCYDSEIVIEFKKGFWNQHCSPGNNCRLIIGIKRINANNAEYFVSVKKIGTLLNREICFAKFQSQISKSGFYVDVEYFSEFERSLVLVGEINSKYIAFKITDIENIKYIYK